MEKVILFFLSIFVVISANSSFAAVVPNYAQNKYQGKELSRAEKKCIDDGYNVTYSSCAKMTAPTERCPHHDNYFKSCSQEQWCKNNNFRFSEAECTLPLYPVKMCDNGYHLFRLCRENIVKACEDEGYSSEEKCKLTEKRCPYSKNYGICCDSCPTFTHELQNIPTGYIASGETCTTCDDVVKTNVIPAPCDGFIDCPYGPEAPNTPSCQQAENMLFNACKTSYAFCQENGYTSTTCQDIEDFDICPENDSLRHCRTNCLKVAQKTFPNADIFAADAANPQITLQHDEIRSLIGLDHPDCQNQQRPTITLNINRKSFEIYQSLFKRKISNLNFKINFEDPLSLPADGIFENVKIDFSGNLPECPMSSKLTEIRGTVSLNNAPVLCLGLKVANEAKFISSGSLKGNVELGDDATLGLKGGLTGSLQTGSYSQVLIKGSLTFKDEFNSKDDDMSIVFGCNSKNKIEKGIFADTSSIYLKSWAKLDTPSINLHSVSDNVNLPNSLSSVHMYKWSKIFTSYGSGENAVVYPISENEASTGCDDKYYIHLGSAINQEEQTLVIEPANLIEDKWQCRGRSNRQLSCN